MARREEEERPKEERLEGGSHGGFDQRGCYGGIDESGVDEGGVDQGGRSKSHEEEAERLKNDEGNDRGRAYASIAGSVCGERVVQIDEECECKCDDDRLEIRMIH